MMRVLDEAGFEGGTLQPVRVDDGSGIPRFYLVRNEGAECDEALLHGHVGYESEAALRIGFLRATRAIRTWHARCCTGWCGLAVVMLAEQVQQAFARRAGEFYRWHSREAAVALALALRERGVEAAMVKGMVRLDSQVSAGSVLETAHWWVEAHGLWIDLSAERFDEYVRGPIAAVHLMPERVSGRYRELGPAETAEYEESEMVRDVLAELAVRA